MKQEELAQLNDEELRQEQKKMKSSKTLNAFLIGFLIGVAVWSALKNGLSFWTLFPLLIAYFAFNNRKKINVLEKELESRNLK